ncbi:MAG: serine hydrolase domain-containing protein [Candidatus Thorarchaeota archaeon]
MKLRGVSKFAIVILVAYVLLLGVPAEAQNDHPVLVWPTEEWTTSTPEEQGMSSTALADVYDHVRTSGADIRSLVVVRHGVIVAEEYFTPQLYDVDNTHILFSVTKSVVSCLIGIAIDHGFIDNTSQLLLDFFPDRTVANMSSWKENITLEDVLMMRSGFQWDEDNYETYNDFFAMRDSDDWAQYVLDRPMAYEPGTTFYYNSGNSHLLATIINVTTAMTPLAFADEYLFGPLGITHRAWSTDPNGINFGGSNLALTPRDMAKFGLLYINNGTWDDQQIVSAGWVYNSSHGPPTPYTQVSYGYQWWIDDYRDWYSARGYNGQFIFVIEEHDIVVVFSSDNEDGPYEYDWLVGNGILGAVTNEYAIPTPTTSTSPTSTPPPGLLAAIPYILVGVTGTAIVAIVVLYTRRK